MRMQIRNINFEIFSIDSSTIGSFNNRNFTRIFSFIRSDFSTVGSFNNRNFNRIFPINCVSFSTISLDTQESDINELDIKWDTNEVDISELNIDDWDIDQSVSHSPNQDPHGFEKDTNDITRRRKISFDKPDIDYKFIQELEQDFSEDDLENNNFRPFQFSMKSIYSPKFKEKLKSKLGCYKKFIKMNKSNRETIQKNVESLFFIEDHFKMLHKKTDFNPSAILKILDSEKEVFIRLFSDVLRGSTTKHRSRCIDTKLDKVFKNFIFPKIQKCSKIISEDELRVLRKVQTTHMFLDKVKEQIFYICVAAAIKKAYNNMFEFNHVESLPSFKEKEESAYLKVLRSEIKQEFKKTLLLFFTRHYLVELEKVAKMKQRASGEDFPEDWLENKTILLKRYLSDKRLMFESEKDWNEFESVIEIILDIFCNAVPSRKLERTITEENGKIKTFTTLHLPKKVENLYVYSNHLPRLIPPKDWDSNGEKDGMSLVKPIHMGASDANFDKKTISSINYTQKKEFIINEKFINLLEEIDKLPSEEAEKMKLNFPTASILEKKVEEVDLFRRSVVFNVHHKVMFKHILEREMQLAVDKKKHFRFRQVWEWLLGNIQYFQGFKYHQNVLRLKFLQKTIYQRQIFNTMLEIGKIFVGFPLYFETLVDYRGRLYPASYLFSRTTGIYKYFVTDRKKRLLKGNGLYYMLKAFFKFDLSIINELEKLKGKTNKALYEFFLEKKKLYEKKGSRIIYFHLLEKEIEALPQNGFRTNFALEIDQKGSHGVFNALILKNKALAEQSNLLGGSPKDLSLYLCSKVSDFIEFKKQEEKNLEENKDTKKEESSNETKEEKDSLRWEHFPKTIEKLLCTFKNINKFPFMTFTYSQKNESRSKRLIEFAEQVIPNLTPLERNSLFKWGFNYIYFLDFCFPGFKKQFDAWTKIGWFFIKSSHEFRIRTMDGTVFKWVFFFEKKSTGSRYNPIKKNVENWTRIRPFNDAQKTVQEQEYKTNIKFWEEHLKSNLSPKELKKTEKKLERERKSYRKFKNTVKDLKDRRDRVFRPGFVHSCDGAVIRSIILEIKKRCDYDINHVHDSINIHPNFVDDFYKVVEEIYAPWFEKDITELFIESNSVMFSDSQKEELTMLVKALEESRDKFSMNLKEFIAAYMYPFEG